MPAHMPPGIAVAQFNDHFFHRIPLGLARYGRELDAALRHQGVTVRPVGAWSNMEPAALAELCAASGGVVLPGGRRSWIARWALLRRPLLESRLEPVDIVHFTAPCYPIPTAKPTVTTIHDIGVYTHPKFFGKAYPRFFHAHLRQIDKRGDRIIAVSDYSAQQWRERISPRARVDVVPEGVADVFRTVVDDAAKAVVLDRHKLDRPFFLAAGSLNPRKNVVRLVQAFSALLDVLPHDLVLVGARGWDDEEIWSSIGDSRVRDRVRFLGFVEDAELNVLYRSATAFAMVSLFEGFGLPAAEAMAGGCPVVAANTTSLPGVVGQGGLLVDPLSVREIAAALRRIATTPALREELSGRALEGSGAFSWEAAATATHAIYRDVLARS